MKKKQVTDHWGLAYICFHRCTPTIKRGGERGSIQADNIKRKGGRREGVMLRGNQKMKRHFLLSTRETTNNFGRGERSVLY